MHVSATEPKFSKLQIRAMSSVVLAPLVLGVIYLGGIWFQLLAVFLLGRSLYEWVRMSLKSSHKVVLGVAGCLYIAVTIACLYLIRMTGDVGVYYFAGFLLTVWASDTGAYFTGKLIGGAKLAPTISPNKTIAGLVGSMFWGGAVLLSYMLVCSIVFDANDVSMLLPAFAVGVVLGLVGQAGDLLISAMKRHVDVKDTGHLIPGHGGVLDRIDAMLLAAPFFYLSISFFGII